MKNWIKSKPVLKHEKRLLIFVKNTEKQRRAVPCVGMFLRGDKEQLDKSSMESDGWPPGNTMGGLKAPLQSLKHKKQNNLCSVILRSISVCNLLWSSGQVVQLEKYQNLINIILSCLSFFVSKHIYRCIFINEHKTYRGLEDVRVSVLTANFISVGYKVDITPHNKCTG